METKEMSYNELVINGFMALFFNLVMLPALVFLNFLIFGQLPWLSIPVLFMLVLLFVLMLPGYFSQEPNEARVMVFFGEYKGTFKNTGFFWVNPFMNKKKLSLRARNLDVEPIKVNDKIGNPILIGLVLVWKLKDTYKAMFEIAAVMLRRQQASAIITAREKIVEGAVSMVKMALDKLAEDGIVELDEEKKPLWSVICWWYFVRTSRHSR